MHSIDIIRLTYITTAVFMSSTDHRGPLLLRSAVMENGDGLHTYKTGIEIETNSCGWREIVNICTVLILQILWRVQIRALMCALHFCSCWHLTYHSVLY